MMIKSESKLPHYGGQALIEGVLMRGKRYVVAAVRKPDGDIHVEHEKLTGIYTTGLTKLPFLRGLVILWDSLSLGMKYLTMSANLQTGEEEEKIEGTTLFLTLAFSIGMAILLFFVLPTLIAELISRVFGLTALALNLAEGLMRLAVMLIYIWVIGFSKDISRVFAYHGAEHKTINAYEEMVEITVPQVKKYPLAHPRCGTSFLLTLVIFSIVVFSLLGPLSLWLRLISRIVLVPVIAMFAYEIIRFMGDHMENPIMRLITAPNLLLQNLTTREPDEKMIEVAITSFKKLLQLEEQME
jgi:uncharacterized protein YqhQ